MWNHCTCSFIQKYGARFSSCLPPGLHELIMGFCTSQDLFFFFFFYNFVYLFPFAGLGLCCCAGFALVRAGGAALSQSAGCPLCCVLLVRSTASVVEVLRLQRPGSIAVVHSRSGLSCPRGLWDLPRPGIKPVSPTLAGGFFTIEPPGKPET